jgi:hypothetical protein
MQLVYPELAEWYTSNGTSNITGTGTGTGTSSMNGANSGNGSGSTSAAAVLQSLSATLRHVI